MNAPLAWYREPLQCPHADYARAAQARQNALTKPPGALGSLETLAIRLAALQRRERPRVDRVHISVFAGDHGVAAEGVSAFPQVVTVEMLKNFVRGGAAISVLARSLGAVLEVVDLGTVAEIDAAEFAVSPGSDRSAISPVAKNDDGAIRIAQTPWTAAARAPRLLHRRLGAGTGNFMRAAAMSEAQCKAALDVGREAVERALDAGAELFIGGEMGIANSSSAAALACALLGDAPEVQAGPGTGLDAAGRQHKAAVIRVALELHAAHLHDPLEALRRLGGFEIAALCGAYLACARLGLVALVDGYIASAAALVAERINPGVCDWLVFAHRSAEPGHTRMLAALDAAPLLDLDLRLGEGSGAAVAVPLLRLACALHEGMATFGEAGVSEKAH